MSNKVKDIDIKNQKYYFLNDMINIKHFDPNNINSDEIQSHTKMFLFTILNMWRSKIRNMIAKIYSVNTYSKIPYFQQSEWVLRKKLMEISI